MKILLLVSGLFFSGGLFADMDYICAAEYKSEVFLKVERCERNNILVVYGIPMNSLTMTIGRWCRHDREINYVKEEKLDSMTLTCVLYDKKPRKLIPIN